MLSSDYREISSLRRVFHFSCRDLLSLDVEPKASPKSDKKKSRNSLEIFKTSQELRVSLVKLKHPGMAPHQIFILHQCFSPEVKKVNDSIWLQKAQVVPLSCRSLTKKESFFYTWGFFKVQNSNFLIEKLHIGRLLLST